MVLRFGCRVIHQYDPELWALGHEEMIAAADVVAQPGSGSLGGYGQPVDRSAFRRRLARVEEGGYRTGGGRWATVEGEGAEDVIDVFCDAACRRPGVHVEADAPGSARTGRQNGGVRRSTREREATPILQGPIELLDAVVTCSRSATSTSGRCPRVSTHVGEDLGRRGFFSQDDGWREAK
jgi:hypothetical protein